ncbi:transposase [Pseudomonas sp. Q2-TVG4-2]|uniref:transposase n=1 Tax=Pseudomonas sp. Q2-TVG4-2 TaxID=1685699 RepID=UPI0035C6E0FE
MVSAPQEIRQAFWTSKPGDRAKSCARLRSLGSTPLLAALTIALRLLGKRWLALTEEISELDKALEHLTREHATRLSRQFGIGPQTAALLLAIAADNPERLRNEAALAALCGVSPLQASSGKTVWHRLNRRGDRAAKMPCGRSSWCTCGTTQEHGPRIFSKPQVTDILRELWSPPTWTLRTNEFIILCSSCSVTKITPLAIDDRAHKSRAATYLRNIKIRHFVIASILR